MAYKFKGVFEGGYESGVGRSDSITEELYLNITPNPLELLITNKKGFTIQCIVGKRDEALQRFIFKISCRRLTLHNYFIESRIIETDNVSGKLVVLLD